MGTKVSDPRGVALRPTAFESGFYRQMVTNLPFGMAVLHLADPADVATWQVVAVNTTASRIAGASVVELMNLPVVPGAKGKPAVNLPNICRSVVARNRSKPVGRLNFETATGSREFYVVSAFPLSRTCAGLLFQDITLLREATGGLIETQWQIAEMCESAGSILWRAHPVTLEFTHVTPCTGKTLGYWIERWLRESNFWKNHVHPQDWSLVEDSCARAAADGGRLLFECRMFSIDGEIRWFRVHVHRTVLRSGQTELAGVMIDITDQKRAAEASREVSIAIMRAQEHERKTISRELHDSIGQHLTGLNYALGSLRRGRAGSRRRRETVGECMETVQLCMKEIRSVSYMLRPPLVDLLGLGPALRSHAEKFSQQSGIHLDVDVPHGTAGLDTDAQMALFRIAQECLTNIQRHARAKSARVRLAYESTGVLLEVEDHGIGIDPHLMRKMETGAAGPGLGLLKMRERVSDLKGNLEIRSNGTGTTVQVKIPRPQAPQFSNGAKEGKIPSKVPSRERQKHESSVVASLGMTRK